MKNLPVANYSIYAPVRIQKFHRKGNPLRKVEVHIPEFCPNKYHTSEVILSGSCGRCGGETIMRFPSHL